MGKLRDILQDSQIQNEYYHSAISSIRYPKRNSELNYEERVYFPQVYLGENEFVMAVRKKELKEIYSYPLDCNIFTKGNFVTDRVQNVFIDVENGVLFTDAPLANSNKNLYVSKLYSVYDMLEEPFVFERDNFCLVVDEEQIALLVNGREAILIRKKDLTVGELFLNFVVYFYILYIGEDAVGIVNEKTHYVKTPEQLSVEGLN